MIVLSIKTNPFPCNKQCKPRLPGNNSLNILLSTTSHAFYHYLNKNCQYHHTVRGLLVMLNVKFWSVSVPVWAHVCPYKLIFGS